MTKKVAALRAVDADEVSELLELSAELRSAFAEIAGAAREGLMAMSVAVGLRVIAEMMEDELVAKVGAKHAKLADRTASRHGSTTGSVVLGGRRVPVTRPRARTATGGEVGLDSYAAFADDDLLAQVVMERMLAGVATRRHRAATNRSAPPSRPMPGRRRRRAVSRRFVAKTKVALEQLMARDLSELEVAALMVDGVHFAEHCAVVALAISADGTKVPVGLWLGDTENTTVVTDLLADLVDRGLSAEGGLLVVIDGAKALAAGVRRVFGDQALIQRCTFTSAATSATTCPRASGAGSTNVWPRRSTTPTPTRVCAPPGTWPANSRRASRPLRPACEKDWTTCSPSAASSSAPA